MLDSPTAEISGGQNKPFELGRALMAEPKLILLDAPAAGINPALQPNSRRMSKTCATRA